MPTHSSEMTVTRNFANSTTLGKFKGHTATPLTPKTEMSLIKTAATSSAMSSTLKGPSVNYANFRMEDFSDAVIIEESSGRHQTGLTKLPKLAKTQPSSPKQTVTSPVDRKKKKFREEVKQANGLAVIVLDHKKDFETSNRFALGVLRKMKENLVDEYQLHAYGRKNVLLCEEVSKILNKWMQVTDVETGCTEVNDTLGCYMIIYFRRSKGFTQAFKRCKYKAQWLIKTKRMRER